MLHHIALKLRNDQLQSLVSSDVGSLSRKEDPGEVSTFMRKGNGGALS
jgi:hypothetical protein